jgi:hypothetical protein
MNNIFTSNLTATKWSMIEKPLTDIERKRNQILSDLGTNANLSMGQCYLKNKLITIGDYYYLSVREEIKDKIILPPKILQQKLEKKLKFNSKNTIIIKNCKKTLDTQIQTLKNIIDDNPKEKIYDDLMNGYDCIEFRIIILMKIIESYSNVNKYNTIDENLEQKEELLIGSKKILHTLKNIIANEKEYFTPLCSIENFKISLSLQLVEDLQYKINVLSLNFGIKLYEIANKRPKLIYDTKYDNTIIEMKIKPYDSQLKFIDIIKSDFVNGFLIIYKTLPGLGKTSTVSSLCSFIKNSNYKYKTIFCCSDILESVRIQVLRIIFNFGIKFAICNGRLKKEKELKDINNDITEKFHYDLKKSWNCNKDDEPELLVCDYVSTYLLLKEGKKNDTNYVLFFDEPTVLTDNNDEENLTLQYLTKILYYMPKHTILSSATFPQLNEIQVVLDYYNTTYPTGKIHEIKSNKTLLGCIIKNFDNQVITPHIYCNNVRELNDYIEKLKNFPLLGKFYTLSYLINLNEFLKKYNLNIDLDDIETFEHENIIENIMNLLFRIVNNFNDEQFKEFKNIKILDINEDNYIDTLKLEQNYNTVCHERLIITHAYKYFGCCWIATSNPLEYVEKYFVGTLNKIKEKFKNNGICSINKYCQKYLDDIKKYNETIDKIESQTETSTNKQKCKTEDRSKTYNEFEHLTQNIEMPKFEFPAYLQVNTHEHIKMFSKYVKMYDTSMLKMKILPETIDVTKFNISDDVKFLLYMGVGLYCKSLDPLYLETVLDLLQDRKLAFIIADKTFCYGANYQISNIIINDDLGDKHSINTILQSIGRTSRMGKSYAGKVYLDTNTNKRIQNFFSNPEYMSNEGINITNSFNNLIKEIDLSQKQKTENEIKKNIELQKLEEKIKEQKIKDDLIKQIEIKYKNDIIQKEQRIQKQNELNNIWNKPNININNVNIDTINIDSKTTNITDIWKKTNVNNININNVNIDCIDNNSINLLTNTTNIGNLLKKSNNNNLNNINVNSVNIDNINIQNTFNHSIIGLNKNIISIENNNKIDIQPTKKHFLLKQNDEPLLIDNLNNLNNSVNLNNSIKSNNEHIEKLKLKFQVNRNINDCSNNLDTNNLNTSNLNTSNLNTSNLNTSNLNTSNLNTKTNNINKQNNIDRLKQIWCNVENKTNIKVDNKPIVKETIKETNKNINPFKKR